MKSFVEQKNKGEYTPIPETLSFNKKRIFIMTSNYKYQTIK